MSFVYRGLEAELDRHDVSDLEVQRNIEKLIQQNPKVTPVTDRPAQLGDEVVLDYAGFCDGEQFAGGTAENQTLVLGSGMFIPGFEEQLVDKVPEEKVIVKVTFPTEYHAPELAGKDAEFHCTIHEIRLKGSYELDDVFAKEVGGCESLDEMRQRMKESMQAYADERGEMELQDQLMRQAAESLELTITDEQLESAQKEQMELLQAQLARQGLNLEMYCSFMQKEEKDLWEEAKPAAEASIRAQAAIDKIVELENLTATEQDIAEAIALIARQNRITVDELKEHYSSDLEAAVIRSVLTTKAMEFIRSNAQIVEE